MKTQIKRVSPHQNGKVVGILMAVSSLVFLVPMFVLMFATMPPVDAQGNPVDFPVFMFLLMPVLYLVFGYIFVLIGSLIYNFLVQYIGGIEFELEDKNV